MTDPIEQPKAESEERDAVARSMEGASVLQKGRQVRSEDSETQEQANSEEAQEGTDPPLRASTSAPVTKAETPAPRCSHPWSIVVILGEIDGDMRGECDGCGSELRIVIAADLEADLAAAREERDGYRDLYFKFEAELAAAQKRIEVLETPRMFYTGDAEARAQAAETLAARYKAALEECARLGYAAYVGHIAAAALTPSDADATRVPGRSRCSRPEADGRVAP